MPVFPPKDTGFGDTSVYPTKTVMDREMPVIGVPYVHGWYKDNIAKRWKNFTSFKHFRDAVKEEEERRKREREEKRKPKEVPAVTGHAYMAPKEYISGFWKECASGDEVSLASFYAMLSRRLGGIPVMESDYRDIEYRSKKKPAKGRYVGGLCDMYSDDGIWKPSGIFVARTDDDGKPVSPVDRMVAAYHEYGHGTGAVSERDAQLRAIWAAIGDRNLAVSRELIEGLKADDYFTQ